MVRNFKVLLIVLCVLLLLGYAVFFILHSFGGANAFLAGFIIIFIDLIFLARYLNGAVKNSSVGGFLLQSLIRWFFIAVCIYVALVVLSLYKWPFIVGIMLPFLGVFITGIYQIIRGKEDGNVTSS